MFTCSPWYRLLEAGFFHAQKFHFGNLPATLLLPKARSLRFGAQQEQEPRHSFMPR
jgi:hypothetical protein